MRLVCLFPQRQNPEIKESPSRSPHRGAGYDRAIYYVSDEDLHRRCVDCVLCVLTKRHIQRHGQAAVA